MRVPRAAGLCALLCLLSASAPQNPGDPLIVTRKTTKLRAQKRSFAPAVADLKEGDQLEFVGKDGAWLSAKFAKVSGFVHGPHPGSPVRAAVPGRRLDLRGHHHRRGDGDELAIGAGAHPGP